METSSIALATKYQRNHKDMLRTIRKQLDDTMYQCTTYLDTKGEQRTMYIITEEGAVIIEQRYNDLHEYHKKLNRKKELA